MVGVEALEEAMRRQRVASGDKQSGERDVSVCFTVFGPTSSAAPLAHCQFKRSGDRGNAGLAKAGNSRVVFGELLVLLVSFLRCRAHT